MIIDKPEKPPGAILFGERNNTMPSA